MLTLYIYISDQVILECTLRAVVSPGWTLRYEERETLPSKRSVQPEETTARIKVLRMEVSVQKKK